MVAREIVGMGMMAIAAACASVCMTLCSLVNEWQIPYYRFAGSAELVIAFGLAVAIVMNGEFSRVKAYEWKWILMRGAFGCAAGLFAWVAVAEGAPLGDASSLGSVNVVVAALLGRAFLGEPLGLLHILALVSSLVGVVLVTKPEAFMGTTHSNGRTAWFGYALALSSGLCSGGLFIASRKSQGVSPLIMSFAVLLPEGLILWVGSVVGLVKDGPMEPWVANPAMGTALFASFLFLFAVFVFAISLGSALCPAAASSTIFTSFSMSLGYVAQSLIHRQRPEVLTQVGAMLMLLAVSLIAAARWCQPKAASARGLEGPILSETNDSVDVEDTLIRDDVQSLAVFIAAEFSGSAVLKSMRQRRNIVAAIAPLRVTLA